jgi:hypothetical protein
LLRGYAFDVRREHANRRAPFALAAVALFTVTLIVFVLPESLVELMQREGVLQGSQGGWAYRLLVLVALAQAAYGGFAILRPERLGPPTSQPEDRARVSATVARTAAGITGLTIVYGIAAFALTGLRGGFWLFVAIALAQGAWYYRAVGIIDTWLELQPELVTPQASGQPDVYCPPLARAFIDARREI